MDMDNFGRVAKMFIDPKANEGYVADGYFNTRVAVIDLDNGKIKRFWGAYGKPPTDNDLGRYIPGQPPAQQFRNPVHCAEMSIDGMVYVCDRPNDRVQVFTKEGKFVSEHIVEPNTLADGSVWDIAFSKDAAQKYLYMADGVNEHVRIFDRKSMTELTNFGYGGRQPGMFLGVHSIATDSKGNIYTTETYTGKRLQKFVFKGEGPVTSEEAGRALAEDERQLALGPSHARGGGYGMHGGGLRAAAVVMYGALAAGRIEHAHLVDVDAAHQHRHLAVGVGTGDDRGVRHPRLHVAAVGFDLDLGPLILPVDLDLAVAQFALEIAVDLHQVADVRRQIVVLVEPVEDVGEDAGSAHGGGRRRPRLRRRRRRFARRVDQQKAVAVLGPDDAAGQFHGIRCHARGPDLQASTHQRGHT